MNWATEVLFVGWQFVRVIFHQPPSLFLSLSLSLVQASWHVITLRGVNKWISLEILSLFYHIWQLVDMSTHKESSSIQRTCEELCTTMHLIVSIAALLIMYIGHCIPSVGCYCRITRFNSICELTPHSYTSHWNLKAHTNLKCVK